MSAKAVVSQRGSSADLSAKLKSLSTWRAALKDSVTTERLKARQCPFTTKDRRTNGFDRYLLFNRRVARPTLRVETYRNRGRTQRRAWTWLATRPPQRIPQLVARILEIQLEFGYRDGAKLAVLDEDRETLRRERL
jgi:hypothetical protein